MGSCNLSMGRKNLHFVQVSRQQVVQLEVHPFLTAAHTASFPRNWYQAHHAVEVEDLLRPVLTRYSLSDPKLLKQKDIRKLSQDCLVGSSVRLGFKLKEKQERHMTLSKSSRTTGGWRSAYIQGVKVVVFVCPRQQGINTCLYSTFSQLLGDTCQTERNDISRYFQRIPESDSAPVMTSTTYHESGNAGSSSPVKTVLKAGTAGAVNGSKSSHPSSVVVSIKNRAPTAWDSGRAPNGEVAADNTKKSATGGSKDDTGCGTKHDQPSLFGLTESKQSSASVIEPGPSLTRVDDDELLLKHSQECCSDVYKSVAKNDNMGNSKKTVLKKILNRRLQKKKATHGRLQKLYCADRKQKKEPSGFSSSNDVDTSSVYSSEIEDIDLPKISSPKNKRRGNKCMKKENCSFDEEDNELPAVYPPHIKITQQRGLTTKHNRKAQKKNERLKCASKVMILPDLMVAKNRSSDGQVTPTQVKEGVAGHKETERGNERPENKAAADSASNFEPFQLLDIDWGFSSPEESSEKATSRTQTHNGYSVSNQDTSIVNSKTKAFDESTIAYRISCDSSNSRRKRYADSSSDCQIYHLKKRKDCLSEHTSPGANIVENDDDIKSKRKRQSPDQNSVIIDTVTSDLKQKHSIHSQDESRMIDQFMSEGVEPAKSSHLSSKMSNRGVDCQIISKCQTNGNSCDNPCNSRHRDTDSTLENTMSLQDSQVILPQISVRKNLTRKKKLSAETNLMSRTCQDTLTQVQDEVDRKKVAMMVLSDEELQSRVVGLKEDLTAILNGSLLCKRHQSYMQGGSARRLLDHNAPLRYVKEGQEDIVMDLLLSMFAHKDQIKNVDYIMRVMLPEALTRVYQQVTGKLEPKAVESAL